MDVKTSNSKPPAMTPAQQGVFFDLIKNQTPSWLLESSSELRNELYRSLKASYQTRRDALEDLKAFKSPEAFCTPLLAKAMSDKLGEPFEVEGVVFQHVRSTSSLLGLRKKLVLPIDRHLLMAACENFEAPETQAGNYHDDSLIYVPERISGRPNKVLSIKPHEFAQLCRTLDLGKQYQAHVKTLFGDGTQKGSLQDKYLALAKDQFEVARHIALMNKHISVNVHQMLKSVAATRSTLTLGNYTLGLQRMEIFGVKINGPMFIGPVSERTDDDYRCVIYMPDDPLHPLKEYVSFTRFEVELSNRLKTTGFRNYFLRFIALKDRDKFMKSLELQLLNPPKSPFPSSSLYTQISGFDLPAEVKADLFKAMFRQRAAQVVADSRLLVVPTDDEDEKTRLARLEAYETIGVNIALFFVSFVPVVGEVMFAVAGFQLLQGIYEGFDSWARGEQEQATDHFFDTLENLILLAAVSAGAAAVGKAYKAVSASDFVQALRAVDVSSGSMRLWKSDLAAYRRLMPTLTNVRLNEQGLLLRQGNRYLSMGSNSLVVRPKPDTGLWEVEPATSTDRYFPVLETNGAGAWRHASELPQDWNLLTLFRRLGYRKEALSDPEVLQILALIGVDETALRQLFIDRRKPMASLIDTARRFRADADTRLFIEQMNSPTSAPYADADLQLFILTSQAKWPREVAVSITDIVAGEVSRYGRASATRTIQIRDESLRNGQYLSQLLAKLGAQERSLLLDSNTADTATWPTLATTLIAANAQRLRLSLYDRLVRRVDVAKLELAAPLRKTYPELPGCVADELVEHADVSEWEELKTDRVPLRLAEEARRYAQVLRMNRAYEGLYLDAASDRGTYLLVLDALENLPGWPNDVSVQIMEWAVNSEGKPGIGPEDASHKILIQAYADRYDVTDDQDKVLYTHANRTREHFFQALWEGLPAHARKGLGVEAQDAGVGLRQKITDLALQRRDAVSLAIGIVPVRSGYSSPMGLADRPIQRSALRALSSLEITAQRSPALVQRARELYPTHSKAQIERFLVTLGTDEVLALRSLESLRQEFQNIRTALEHWIHRESHYQEGDGPRLKVPRHSKIRAAQAILRAWRKETDVTHQASSVHYRLAFDANPLGDLPVIVGRFDHIGTLEMNQVGSSAGLNTFLRNFTRLHSLSLTGNQLTRIPQAVADMPNLTRLDLSDNQILLTPEAITSLSGKTHLQTLNLSFNPTLGQRLTVSTLLKLRHLALRGTGAIEWPVGTSDLPDLQTLDLRDNAIEQIPQTVFEARTELNRGTNVDGNPLSPSSLQAIASYHRSNGINLGVITADYRPVSTTPPVLDPQGANWMAGTLPAQVAQRQVLWKALSVYPNAGDFFYLLGQLLNTADFIRLPTTMSQRVWEVLEAAGEDDVLRRSLFRISRIGRTSADDPARIFSNLEVRVLCFRAMAAARVGGRSLEGELVALLRGLFRLQQVERQALIDTATRINAGSFTGGQAHELSLAYRVGLAQRLDLLAQPRQINVRLDVEVSPQQLENAYQAVVKAETSEALLQSVNTRGFWYEYLLTTYEGQFTEISERTAQALIALEAQVDLPRITASQRMKAIIENDKNQNRQLLRRMTTEALARHPGLSLPTPSVSGGTQRSAT
jgi:hypothetical protein